MPSAVVVIVNLSVYLSVSLSHSWTLPTCSTYMYDHDVTFTIYGSPIILVFYRKILSHSNGITFIFKVNYKWGRQNVFYAYKCAL